MNLNSAKSLALRLMRKHGLISQGWAFRWNNNARRAGVCKIRLARMLRPHILAQKAPIPQQKRIELSRHWTRIHSPTQVKNTVLHEIAHALAGLQARHGSAWKEIAARIGAAPRSCFVDARLAKKPNYTIFCENCGRPHHLYKLSSAWRKRSCKICASAPIIFDHRRKMHFHYVTYSSLATRRRLTKRENLPKFGARLRLRPPDEAASNCSRVEHGRHGCSTT